jgi:uncharacterized membrane protein
MAAALSEPSRAAGRLGFVDTHRGIAVVLMILWHSVDSWLSDDARTGTAWSVLRFLGGMAAPSFLLLAGSGVGLKLAVDDSANRPLARARHSLSIRGLEVLAYGYLLRLQFWAVDAGGFLVPRGYTAWIPLALGYGVILWALARRSDTWRALLPWVGLGILLAVVGYVQLENVTPGRILRVLRVDVLQAIGVSIVVLAQILTRLAGPVRLWFCLAAAILAAAAASYTHTVMPGPLPAPIAGYLGAWKPPAGQPSATLFPLLPWIAYAFVGAALAQAWHRAGARVARLVTGLAIVGVAVAVPTSESWSHVHVVMNAAPLLVQPLRVTYRVAVLLVITLCALGLDSRLHQLRRFGQSSLLIYWLHLEFTFGLIASPLKRTMNLWQWFGAFTILTLLMYGVVRFRQGPLTRKLNAFEKWLATRRAT